MNYIEKGDSDAQLGSNTELNAIYPKACVMNYVVKRLYFEKSK